MCAACLIPLIPADYGDVGRVEPERDLSANGFYAALGSSQSKPGSTCV